MMYTVHMDQMTDLNQCGYAKLPHQSLRLMPSGRLTVCALEAQRSSKDTMYTGRTDLLVGLGICAR